MGEQFINNRLRHWITLAGILGIGLASTMARAAEPRPQAHAVRVPAGSFSIDGRSEDWQRIGGRVSQHALKAAGEKHVGFAYPERGAYQGAADTSLMLWTAVDEEALYLLADVRDQLLINDVADDAVFQGDDFEIFLDTRSLDARYTKRPNDPNVRQLVFIPAFINPRFSQVYLWKAEQYPGVVAASRLRPWGYTIEVKIPRSVFPYWREHPELSSVGFEVCINDADASGVDLYHAAIKHALFAFRPWAHFLSPEKLGELTFASEPIALGEAPAPVAETPAQRLLDNLADLKSAGLVNEALGAKDREVRKAALMALAKLPTLPVSIDTVRTLIRPPADRSYGRIADPDLLTYALVILAQRKQLPVKDYFGYYLRVIDPGIRLTYLWCAGINGDRTIRADIEKLLLDGNIRVRNMAAIALGMLGDPQSLPALREMVDNDAHHYGREQAKVAVKQIETGSRK